MPGELYVFDKVPVGYRGHRAMEKAFVPLLPVREMYGGLPPGDRWKAGRLEHALRAGGRKRRVPEGKRIHGSVKRKGGLFISEL